MKISQIQSHNNINYYTSNNLSFLGKKNPVDSRVILGIYGDLGIQAAKNKNDEITLSHYATPEYNPRWEEYGLTEENYENKLLENIIKINKQATFSGENNIIAPKLKEVGGCFCIDTKRQAWINGRLTTLVSRSSFPVLESTGNFDLSNSHWEDSHLEKYYPSLKLIRGIATVPVNSFISINDFYNIEVYNDIINVWDDNFEYQYT